MSKAPIALLCLLSGMVGAYAGLYFGVRIGASTISHISADVEVTNALRRIDNALAALQSNDLGQSQRQHRRELMASLLDVARWIPSAPGRTCFDRDRQTIATLLQYLDETGDAKLEVPTNVRSQVLSICD